MRILTLYYHRINELNDDFNLLAVTPEKFRQHMLWIKHHLDIVRSDEDWSNIKGNAICITFDDGYKDNLLYASQILKELNIPATIFISTGVLTDDSCMWWDELEYYILADPTEKKPFELVDNEYGCIWEMDSLDKRKNCYRALHYLMKNHAKEKNRKEWLQQLEKWSGKERLQGEMLTDAQCKELSFLPQITIGAHTVTHPALAKLEYTEQKYEIAESIDTLKKLTGKDITVFSYPFGQKDIDYTQETIEIIKNTDIKKAFTTNHSLWKEKNNQFEIPRCVVRNWGLFEFIDEIRRYQTYE